MLNTTHKWRLVYQQTVNDIMWCQRVVCINCTCFFQIKDFQVVLDLAYSMHVVFLIIYWSQKEPKAPINTPVTFKQIKAKSVMLSNKCVIIILIYVVEWAETQKSMHWRQFPCYVFVRYWFGEQGLTCWSVMPEQSQYLVILL